MQHLMNTYGRLPVSIARGEGPWVWDTEGRRYLDALTGIAVTGLGHAHPRVVAAIAEQAARVIHASNLYRIPEQERLADTLARVSGMDRAFFCNSGCEANEAAIKLARLHGHHRGIEQPVIVVMEKAFHGRTMATLSATGSRKVQAGFEPLLAGFARVPYGERAPLESLASRNGQVVAVLAEPIQGEGGIHIPDEGWLRFLRDLCDRQGWLLMLDEVQSGMGRTGRWFAHQHAGIVPDVMTLAKGLGNGVPIGACLARGHAAEVFTPGKHGSTFGGNPLVCAAAQATLDAIEQEQLMENATRMGGLIRAGLAQKLDGVAGVRQIRGKGLMIGIELDRPCGELVSHGLRAGLLINVTSETVVRLLPPLILQAAEAGLLVDTLAGLIRAFLQAEAAAPVAG
ncbi:MAG: acetylornithine transaminase [Betaproteobacteria bacterium]|jgi:acetylornithine/N-succinyldiaminopimelate aminotransferase|nr:acetylornithine transaminase [Rhodocyclaceae bacterium]MCA3132976.1 acetylornithine transaminase [Rhodocyclaceae bacterium]MCA3141945.1 acetylornithine transaminase [Rhodocyclaceae bacterium]MCA3144853.1 acetylornithine transaminase [Rhodocyclaceae bacterium]